MIAAMAARLRCVVGILVASARLAAAQGTGSGSGSGTGSGGDDIEIDDAAQPKPKPDKPTATAPDAAVKDPAVAKKWLAAAQQLVARGDQLARAGKPDDARAQYGNAAVAYAKAIDAGGDVAIYAQLAAVEDKLGDPAGAYKHLKRVVDPKAGAKPDVVKAAQKKLDEVAAKVGLVTLAVSPDGTSITIAGAQVGEAPMTEPLVLAPGAYTVSFAAAGFQPKVTELQIEAGSETERKIVLDAVPITITPMPRTEPDGDTPPPSPPDRLPLYVGGGATVGLAVVATITGIAAISQHDTYVAKTSTSTERDDARKSGRLLAHVTDACVVGALGAAGFTAYWYVYKYKPAHDKFEKQPAGAKLSVVPWVQAGAGGAVAVGSF